MILYLILLSNVSCNTQIIPVKTKQLYNDGLLPIEKRKNELTITINHSKLYHYNRLSDSSAHIGRWEKASYYLDTAVTFSNESSKDSIIEKRAFLHFKAKNYDLAIVDYSTLIQRFINYDINLYHRALCYQKKKNTQLAVNDLKEAILWGNEDAEKLHEKINPIRKRVSYYVTRCWDGSTSNAKGRGACSHHGGVKNWNEPVYETYRKY